MSINSIILLSIYSLFFITLITGALCGIKRGLKKSAIRLGTLIVFLVVAGFIAAPIAKALLTIDLSSFNWEIGGQAVSSVSDIIKNSLFTIESVQEAAQSTPSVMTLIESLPVAVMSLVVFIILIYVMQFLSWIVYIILEKTTLKESRLEKQIRKQKKLEKKNKKSQSGEQVTVDQKTNAITPPKKMRTLGGLVGAVQGFILMFLFLMPITSLCGTMSEVAQQSYTPNTLTVYADDDNESLSEFSSDILRNTIGEEIVSYFTTFSNSFPAKVLTLGGFNDVIFDSLTSITINDQKIAIRSDVLTATKIYDKYVSIMDEINIDEPWKDFNFDNVQEISDLVFSLGIVRAFAEDLAPYALSKLYDTDSFLEMMYSTEIQDAIDLIVDEYKEDSRGFILAFKGDVDSFISIARDVFKSGLFDEILTDASNYSAIIGILEEDDCKLVDDLADKLFDSYILKVSSSKGLNIALNYTSDMLSSDTLNVNLGTTNYEEIDWNNFKSFISDTLKNLIEAYNLIDLYNFDSVISDPKTIADFSGDDLQSLLSLAGKQIDLLNDASIFSGSNTPVNGLIDWVANEVPDYLEAEPMKAVESWESELTNLSASFKALKDSGIFEELFEDVISTDDVIAMLLDPVSSTPGSNTYVKEILTPVLNSTITKKFLSYCLNRINTFANESISGLVLQNISAEDLSNDQNDDIVEIVENFLNCYTIFTTEFNIDTISEANIPPIAALLTSLQRNAFRVGAGAGIEKMNSDVNLTDKKVNGGGIFSNFYIAFISYIAGDSTSIQYKTINWYDFLTSLNNLNSVLNNIGEDLEEILNNISDSDDLEDLLNSLGLDGDIVNEITTIQDTLDELSNGTTLTNEEAFERINQALSNILASEDGEGNSTIDAIVQMIGSTTGTDVSGNISSQIIANEQVVSNRINYMITTYSDSSPLDYTVNELDPFNTEDEELAGKTVFEATIEDLTCGATYVLTQAVNNNVKIYITGIDEFTLAQAINEATEDVEIRNLVLQLFERV